MSLFLLTILIRMRSSFINNIMFSKTIFSLWFE